MSLSAADWVKLNRLLDEALDLEPAAREAWLQALPPEHDSIRATLHELLIRKTGVETSEVMRRSPLFANEAVRAMQAGDLVGAYRLIREIGAGGMSTVWLAERADGSLQRQVALKLPRVAWIDHGLAARLNRERDIAAALEHPSIARLYDAGVDEAGRPFLALEYIDGLPLDRYATEKGLNVAERIELFIQVALAVEFAHTRLIVHRDLKPNNVLVKTSGEVRLLDFGIARLLLPESVPDAQQTQLGARAFTPRYAAPEQFLGQPATVATDVYSLGVMLYELLAGKSPYRRVDTSLGEIERAVVRHDPVPIASVVDSKTASILRGDLETIVGKALKKEQRDRYATVGALIEDLRRYQQDLPVHARPDQFAYRAKKFMKRHRVALSLYAALLVTVIAGAGVSIWQSTAALRERDRALRLYQQADAINHFWNRVLTEATTNRESVSVPELLERSERLAERSYAAAPLQYSMAVDTIAALYISYGLPGKAEEILIKAIERTKELEQGDHRAESLRCKYAMAIGALGRAQEADEIFRSVIEATPDAPDLLKYCWHRRSIVARDNNDANGALRYMKEAIKISSSSIALRSEDDAAQLVGDLAYAQALTGASDEARRNYEESWRLFGAAGRDESPVALTVLNNWGILDISVGNPAGALERFDRATAIAQKRSPDGNSPPYLLNNRANSLTSLARFEEALRDYEKAEVSAARDGNVRAATYAISGIADIYLRLGNAERAQKTLDRLAAPKNEDRSPATLRRWLIQGRLWAKQGRATEALTLFDKAIETFEANGTAVGGLAMARIARAELLVEAERFDAALIDSRRAIEVATKTRGGALYSSVLGSALLMDGVIHGRRNDKTSAVASLRGAVANLENSVGVDHPDSSRARTLLTAL